MLLFSRQGKVRLQKWFYAIGDKERKKIIRDLVALVLSRRPKMCNFLDWKDFKVGCTKSEMFYDLLVSLKYFDKIPLIMLFDCLDPNIYHQSICYSFTKLS